MSYAPSRPGKYCRACTNLIDAEAVICPHCGVPQTSRSLVSQTEKRVLPTFLLCFLLGVFGAHRFYAGKPGTALLQLFTLGGLGIWVLIDLIFIITGNFSDGDGQKITEWT